MRINEFKKATREMGIEINEINAYVKQQKNTCIRGYGGYSRWLEGQIEFTYNGVAIEWRIPGLGAVENKTQLYDMFIGDFRDILKGDLRTRGIYYAVKNGKRYSLSRYGNSKTIVKRNADFLSVVGIAKS